jgi:two-component system sensor histidine kinase BaeS
VEGRSVRLRHRLLGYFALTAIACCALTVGIGVLLVRHQISSQRTSTLETQANELATFGGAPGALGPGEHVYAVRSGRVRQLGPARAVAVLEAIPPSGDGQGSATVLGHSILYAARATPAGRVVLIRSGNLAFAEWRPFLWSLVLAGIGGVALAAALSFLLARRLSRPIGELAGATHRLARAEPGVTVPVEGDDEIADLGHAFNDMSGQLQAAREAHQRFLESVSHELRTPLTSIRGYSEALTEDAVGGAEAGRVILAESERLERLVADLLEMARFDRAGFSVRIEPIDLAEIARQAAERHLPRARAVSVDLRAVHAGETRAVGDPGRVLQAASNLIENALRLTPPGGSVVVKAGPGRLSVSDTGPGLAADDIPHAFERFYLHDRYRSERPVGSGLGLAIVRELAVAMGGSVEAAGSPGAGAVFTLRLPQDPRLEANVRTLEVALDQAQESGGGRSPRPAVHETGPSDHGRGA